MVVPGLRLDDYVYMYTFISIFKMPSGYKSIFVLHRHSLLSKQEMLTPP